MPIPHRASSVTSMSIITTKMVGALTAILKGQDLSQNMDGKASQGPDKQIKPLDGAFDQIQKNGGPFLWGEFEFYDWVQITKAKKLVLSQE